MRIIAYIALICTANVFAQNDIGYLFEEMPSDSVTPKSIRKHTRLKPLIRQANTSNEKTTYIQISGLSDLNYFQQVRPGLKTGLGLELKGAIKDKLTYRIAGVEGISESSALFTPKAYISDSLGQFLLYSDIRSRISYTPNKVFNFQIGLDHNFIGEGSRSMFLGDYGDPYPFGQIRMRFWRVEYSILYQFLRERDNNRWEGKFMSSHYLTFNAAKWLSLGLFETVIFQPKDTLLNRGFDAEYLNPFIFYRPQEYSLGSSDNVLIGIDLSAYWREHTFYAQFILDEFFLEEIKQKSGWWANKYGGQFGIKGRFHIGKNDFFYRLEYNFARPYTYSHLSEELNYGNQNTSMAHPYGANFMELLGELKWQRNQFFGKLFTNYFLRGNDKDGYNYGGDIYQSYVNRPYDYDHYIGQGQGYNGVKTVLTFGYKVLDHGNLNAFIENHFGGTTRDNKLRYSLVVGLRSMLWNDYRNY